MCRKSSTFIIKVLVHSGKELERAAHFIDRSNWNPLIKIMVVVLILTPASVLKCKI
jgi:hypothetical protein